MLGGTSFQSSQIVCFQGLLSLLMSRRSFFSSRLGGLGLTLTQLLPSAHKGSGFPVQLNSCHALCFLQFPFGPCSSLATMWNTQPWPLPAALPCVPALWDGSPRIQLTLLCWLGYPSSCHGGPHSASLMGSCSCQEPAFLGVCEH